jgi:hypothetical protein
MRQRTAFGPRYHPHVTCQSWQLLRARKWGEVRCPPRAAGRSGTWKPAACGILLPSSPQSSPGHAGKLAERSCQHLLLGLEVLPTRGVVFISPKYLKATLTPGNDHFTGVGMPSLQKYLRLLLRIDSAGRIRIQTVLLLKRAPSRS